MSRFTKISGYRQSDIRFGSKEPKIDNSVKVYQLSPEELEQYRNGEKGGSRMIKKEDYLKLKAEGKTDKEAQQALGIDHNKLYRLKKQWDLIGERGNPVIPPVDKKAAKEAVVQPENDWQEKYIRLKEDYDRLGADYLDWQNEIERLNNENKTLTSSVNGLKQTISYLENVSSNLQQEYDALQRKYAELESACEDVESETEEIEKLKFENNRLSFENGCLKKDLEEAHEMLSDLPSEKTTEKVVALEQLLKIYMG